MKKLRSIHLLATGSAVAMMMASSVAHAQDDSNDLGASAPVSGLDEIVVTARKRVESAQDVPVAVTAISPETIVQQDLTSIEKIAARTPNLNVGRASNGSGAQVTMRGIGSSSTSIGIEQSVAVVVDGVYYGQGRIINEGFFDLAGAEILKGPQALFFGKNATAGVISLTTADPGSEFEARLTGSYEFVGEKAQIEGIVSTPISDTLGVRVAVRGSKMYGHYWRNEQPVRTISYGGNNYTAQPAPNGPGEEELVGRITMKWEPSNDFTATLKVSGSANDIESSSWNYAAYNCGRDDNRLQIVTEYECSNSEFVTHQSLMPEEVAAVFPYAKSDGELYNRYRSVTSTLNLVYETDNITLTSVSNYNWNNNRWTCACDYQSNFAAVMATENSSFDAFSTEFRALTGFDGPINLMLGTYYQKTKRDYEQYVSFGISDNGVDSGPNRYLDAAKLSDTDGETIAAFGQVLFEITPTLELATGVRYTHETKDSSFVQPFVSPAFSGAWTEGLVTIADQTFNNWSPEATLTWKPTSDVMVYGAFKTAYKSGGFSNGGISSLFGNPQEDLTFEPERAIGFEAGVKSELLDRQLRLNLGLYNYKYKDLQIDFFNSTIIAFQTLTADARTKGAELQMEFAPNGVPGLNIRGSVNYTRARYTDFAAAPCYGGQTAAEGCDVMGGTRQNLNGAPLAVAPDWTGSFGVSYDTDIGSNLEGGFSIDTRYSDSYLVSGFNAEHSRQDSYGIIDASVRVGAADEIWQLALIGKNLTDKLYIAGGVDGPNTPVPGSPVGQKADQLGFGNLPRTVMIQATTRF